MECSLVLLRITRGEGDGVGYTIRVYKYKKGGERKTTDNESSPNRGEGEEILGVKFFFVFLI